MWIYIIFYSIFNPGLLTICLLCLLTVPTGVLPAVSVEVVPTSSLFSVRKSTPNLLSTLNDSGHTSSLPCLLPFVFSSFTTFTPPRTWLQGVPLKDDSLTGENSVGCVYTMVLFVSCHTRTVVRESCVVLKVSFCCQKLVSFTSFSMIRDSVYSKGLSWGCLFISLGPATLRG